MLLRWLPCGYSESGTSTVAGQPGSNAAVAAFHAYTLPSIAPTKTTLPMPGMFTTMGDECSSAVLPVSYVLKMLKVGPAPYLYATTFLSPVTVMSSSPATPSTSANTGLGVNEPPSL